jgi:F-type H+-transporting ATPase subunit b
MEIQVGAILLQMINVGVVVGALSFLLFKPVRRILDERSRKVEEGQRAAEAALADREEASGLKQSAKRDAQKEVKGILDEARSDAQTSAASIIADAEKEAEQIREKARQSMAKEKEALRAELQTQFEQAVVDVTQAVIGETITAKKHQELIKKGLQEIAA